MICGALIYICMGAASFVLSISPLLSVTLFFIIWILICISWYKRRLEEQSLIIARIEEIYKDNGAELDLKREKYLYEFDDRDEVILSMASTGLLVAGLLVAGFYGINFYR